MLKYFLPSIALAMGLTGPLRASERSRWLAVNETMFEYGEPECFQYAKYDPAKQSADCEIPGRLRIYLKSFPPVVPGSSAAADEIECRWGKRKGSLFGREIIEDLSRVNPKLADRCFWVPVIKSSFMSSRRLIKIWKAGKIYSDDELTRLACSEVWTACRFVEKAEIVKEAVKMVCGPEFQKKFQGIKIGTSKSDVIRALGEPVRQEKNRLSYFEFRAPKPGEQLSIYVVHLKDDKVKKLEILPGPSATGSAL